MLSVEHLNYSYSKSTDSRLFENVNVRISQAEHVVIVGDSGGGKSTLLNLIADGQQPAITAVMKRHNLRHPQARELFTQLIEHGHLKQTSANRFERT